jgi:hypothetical protein
MARRIRNAVIVTASFPARSGPRTANGATGESGPMGTIVPSLVTDRRCNPTRTKSMTAPNRNVRVFTATALSEEGDMR